MKARDKKLNFLDMISVVKNNIQALMDHEMGSQPSLLEKPFSFSINNRLLAALCNELLLRCKQTIAEIDYFLKMVNVDDKGLVKSVAFYSDTYDKFSALWSSLLESITNAKCIITNG